MNNTAGKQQKPMWMTVLVFVVVIGIFIAKQMGWISSSSDKNQNTTGKSSPTQTDRSTDEYPRKTTPTTPDKNVPQTPHAPDLTVDSDGGIRKLYENRISDRIVTASGTVVHILPDDLDTSDGSGMHQLFLVELSSDITIKISNNIDFSRVPVKKGDTVRFRGEYEYNEKGGVVHWTHKDPGRRHADGWIEHNGKKYD